MYISSNCDLVLIFRVLYRWKVILFAHWSVFPASQLFSKTVYVVSRGHLTFLYSLYSCKPSLNSNQILEFGCWQANDRPSGFLGMVAMSKDAEVVFKLESIAIQSLTKIFSPLNKLLVLLFLERVVELSVFILEIIMFYSSEAFLINWADWKCLDACCWVFVNVLRHHNHLVDFLIKRGLTKVFGRRMAHLAAQQLPILRKPRLRYSLVIVTEELWGQWLGRHLVLALVPTILNIFYTHTKMLLSSRQGLCIFAGVRVLLLLLNLT